MNEASVEGLIRSGHTSHEKTFLSKIRHSNEVFSAFKCHSMGSKMQERLYDEEGKLRPFKEWRENVRPIASHQTGAWLKTEYDTAVLRAHQASDWQEFEQNKDILPNLRWMPTTSPTPENVHEGFWSSKLTLPIDDPFWVQNHPANRWNCKCSLEATDEPSSETTPPPSETPKPQAGLEENPRHGHIFSDKHPYFPKSCSACPFYSQKKGLKNWIGRLLENRQKDCHDCPYVNRKIIEAELRERYPQERWEHSYISESGGYVVTEKERIKEGKRNSREKKVYEKEMSMARVCADHGYKIEYLKGEGRKIGETHDIMFDGSPADLKSFSGSSSLVKQIKHALAEQGAEVVIVRLEKENEDKKLTDLDKMMDKLMEARRKLRGKIFYYIEGENKLIELIKE